MMEKPLPSEKVFADAAGLAVFEAWSCPGEFEEIP